VRTMAESEETGIESLKEESARWDEYGYYVAGEQ